jgi:hypothetical protein
MGNKRPKQKIEQIFTRGGDRCWCVLEVNNGCDCGINCLASLSTFAYVVMAELLAEVLSG